MHTNLSQGLVYYDTKRKQVSVVLLTTLKLYFFDNLPLLILEHLEFISNTFGAFLAIFTIFDETHTTVYRISLATTAVFHSYNHTIFSIAPSSFIVL